jgi:hypothetical protein
MKVMMNMLVILYLLVTGSGIYKENDQSVERQQGPTDVAKRAVVREIYTAELDVRERSGKNDGDKVEEYLKQVGLKKGEPWCAAFVCWVYDRAGINNPNSGWAASLFPNERVIWARNRVLKLGGNGYKKNLLPQTGDVFGMWFPEKKRIAHAGFVDSWTGSWLITVEGNTNIAGNREGDGVYRKRRLVQSVYRVADWVGE